VAILRWQAFTGKQATCDGQTYAQLAASRTPAQKPAIPPEAHA
jgi:hypothetical protein